MRRISSSHQTPEPYRAGSLKASIGFTLSTNYRRRLLDVAISRLPAHFCWNFSCQKQDAISLTAPHTIYIYIYIHSYLSIYLLYRNPYIYIPTTFPLHLLPHAAGTRPAPKASEVAHAQLPKRRSYRTTCSQRHINKMEKVMWSYVGVRRDGAL